MRFTPDFIQQLKASISLVDIASENIELRKTGNRYMGRCPFHGDRSPSFSVNRDFYYCFGCKETGDVIKFVTSLHGLSFEEAVEDLAEKAKLPLPEGDSKLSSAEEQALYLKRQQIQKGARLNYFASLKYYQPNLLNATASPLFQEAREYLKKRGISSDIIEKFQIGVSGSQSDGLAQFLTKAKAPLEIARQFHLIRPSTKTTGDYDFFRERLLFPLIDVRGRVCGFGGRILPSIQNRPTEHKLPKYLNSAESELFQKSKFLYGLYQAKRAIREEETAILVEGYFDTVAMHQHGFENVVAPCGTSFTEDHLKILTRLAKRIIVFFDQDEAGINATTKSMELALKHGTLVYGIQFKSKLDPDEYLLENPIEHLANLKKWISEATPLLDSLIERSFVESADNVEARTQAIKQAVAWLTMYSDPVGRAVRANQLIDRWKVPEVALGSLRGSGSPVRANPARSNYSQNNSQAQSNPGQSDLPANYAQNAGLARTQQSQNGKGRYGQQGRYGDQQGRYGQSRGGDGQGYSNRQGGDGSRYSGRQNSSGSNSYGSNHYGQSPRYNQNVTQMPSVPDYLNQGSSDEELRVMNETQSSETSMPANSPNPPNQAVRRQRPIPLQDRQLLQFLVKFEQFGEQFLEARKHLAKKDTLSGLFDDREIIQWLDDLSNDPTGFSKLKLVPEAVMTAAISQELRSVILEGLLETRGAEDQAILDSLLKRAVHKSWARFSHELSRAMAVADSAQDSEKLKELSEQFLDLQRKLKEFEDSYVSGKID